MRAGIFSSFFAGIFALLVMALNGPAAAQPYGNGPAYRYERGIQPLDRLLPGIRRQHPGDFYDAEGPTYGPTGDPHYHLKWMTPDGRVIWFDADARNGRVLRTAPGRDSFDDNRPGENRFQGPPRGYGDRYPPSSNEPYRGYDGYDRRYGGMRNFGPGAGPGPNTGPSPGYVRPFREFDGRGGDRGDGGRGGRWRH